MGFAAGKESGKNVNINDGIALEEELNVTLYLLSFWTGSPIAMTLIDLLMVIPMKLNEEGKISMQPTFGEEKSTFKDGILWMCLSSKN